MLMSMVNVPDNRRSDLTIVAMSGGVDSSVAALCLKQQGRDIAGMFMKNWEDDDSDEYCSSRQDLVDAAAAADVIGIDFQAEAGKPADLRAFLRAGDRALTETWTFPWLWEG